MRKLYYILLSAIVISAFFSCQEEQEDAELSYKDGVDLFVRENKYNEAADKLLHSLSLQNENEPTQLLISTYRYLSSIYWEQDFIDKASYYAQKGLECTEVLKNDSLQSQLLNRVASCYYLTPGKADSAYIYYNRLLELCILRGDTVMACNACNNIGSVLLTLDKPDEALAMFDKSQEHSRHRTIDSFKYHYNRSRCFQSQGKWAECTDEIRKTLQYVDTTDIEALEKIYQKLYVCKKHLGEYEEACVYADSSYYLADSLFRFKQREELKNITEKYQEEKYESELQLQQSRWVLVVVCVAVVALILIVAVMYFSKKRMVKLQRRMDTLKLQISKEKEQCNQLTVQEDGEEPVEKSKEENLDKLYNLYSQQMLVARDIYRSRPAYNKLRQLRYHIDKGYLSDDERLPLIDGITEVFIDPIHNLRSTFPELTADECLYAILVFVGCENSVISILTKTSEATLRKRRSRFKQKCHEQVFALLMEG